MQTDPVCITKLSQATAWFPQQKTRRSLVFCFLLRSEVGLRLGVPDVDGAEAGNGNADSQANDCAHFAPSVIVGISLELFQVGSCQGTAMHYLNRRIWSDPWPMAVCTHQTVVEVRLRYFDSVSGRPCPLSTGARSGRRRRGTAGSSSY